MRNERPLTTGDVAKYCHVTPHAVAKWIRAGKLEAYRTPGGQYRVERRLFLEFLRQYEMPIPVEFQGVNKKKALILDDEPAVARAISWALRRLDAGISIASASDGYEACIKAGLLNPDLVILDLVMPNMDGGEVCRQLRAHPETKDVKILVVTGAPTPENIKRITGLGADAWLEKPLKVEELQLQLRELLDL